MLYTVDMVYTVDMAYTVDMVYTVDMAYTVDTMDGTDGSYHLDCYDCRKYSTCST